MIERALLSALIVFFAPEVLAGQKADQLCAELAHFASAVPPGDTHAVLLRGGWGGDKPNVIMTHDCQSFGFEPGDNLCSYLVQNTSWEFGQYNARRAADCLDTPLREEFKRQLAEYKWPAELSGYLLGASDGALITIRFEALKFSQLTLTVARER